MDLTEYRTSESERQRNSSLIDLIPDDVGTALDVGARDGFFSRVLADRISAVTALDLEKPSIVDARIHCVQGNATDLQFEDGAFDLVFCAEVLEHIPGKALDIACRELARVTKRYLLIGVPYRQDIRNGRSTCGTCGGKNPPWGHVNTFDEKRLLRLFPHCEVVRKSLVGTGDIRTNALSCKLMDLAGNPYGSYDQEETCVHCGVVLSPPPPLSYPKRILAKTAVLTQDLQQLFARPTPNWIHILFRR